MNEFSKLPFVKGCIIQKYFGAEKALQMAHDKKCSHYYLDCTLDENSLSTWTPDRIKSIKSKMEKYNIQAVVHGRDTLPIAHKVKEIRKAAIDVIKQEIEFATSFSNQLVIHGGQIQSSRNVQLTKILANSLLIESLHELMDYASQHDIQLLLENQSNFKHSYPFYNIFCIKEDYDAVLTAIPDMKMVLDVGHMNVNNSDYVATIQRYHKNIKALSLSDNNGIKDSHSKVGTGTVNWKMLIELLVDLQWSGMIVFETPSAEIEDNQDHIVNTMKLTRKSDEIDQEVY